MRSLSAILLIASVLLAGCAAAKKAANPERRSVTVTATPVALNPDDPSQTRVGALTYIAGWALTASDDDFGGFSGLDIRGGRVTMISDSGVWFDARLTDGGTFEDATLEPFAVLAADKTQRADKVALDAEDLTFMPPFGYLVSFEQRHRVERVWVRGEPATPIPALEGDVFDEMPKNGGLEALTLDAEGRIIMFGERGRRGDLTPAWRMDHRRTPELFLYRAPGSHAATSAALLPSGDLILTTRKYSVIDGVSVKIVRVDADTIGLGNVVEGDVLATLAPPLTADNFEGIAVTEGTRGPRLWIVSDDNHNPLQRTLLMVFELED